MSLADELARGGKSVDQIARDIANVGKPRAVPQLQGLTQITGSYPGMVAPGNIDLTARPQVRNPDGSVSTVRSASYNLGDGETLLPTVSDDGRLLSDDDAIDLYLRTGRHLGKFATPSAADLYARQLHEQQAAGLRAHLKGR